MSPVGPVGSIGPVDRGVRWIESVIPHREAMLLVDRVTDLVPGESVTAVKAVTHTEPWFRGGSGPPDYPLPLVLESWNQAAAVLVLSTWAQDGARGGAPSVAVDGVPMLGSYGVVHVGSAVRPGEVMEHSARVESVRADTMVLAGEVRVGDRLVLRFGHAIVIRKPVDVMSALRDHQSA